MNCRLCLAIAMILLLLSGAPVHAALSGVNLPLDSPAYGYLDKLAGLGLISSDFRGIRPITRVEAARLLQEAAGKSPELSSPFVDELMAELRKYLQRELAILANPAAAPVFAVKPLAEAKMRYVYLDGVPRNYQRPVFDPGNDGVFGIGSGLRPANSPGTNVSQQGGEGTPLLENNEGISYGDGSNLDLRLRSEMYLTSHGALFLEPMLYATDGILQGRFNKGYLKLGGGGLELEVGRDENWLGFGERGAITLSNNAANFDLLKLSSPEPVAAGFLGMMKYALILARFDSSLTANGERQPYFYALKASLKPVASVEIGLNLGRQQGGQGVSNSLRDNLQGLVGGTNKDNSNSLSGLELRWRIAPWRNSELYIEFSGEDAAKFWPIVESYLAGFYLPGLTADGKNDFRFEYFLGNQILYTHSQFSEGYVYKGLPIGNSQGGATQDFFCRYQHWFSARERVGLDYIHTSRGNVGRVDKQALEEKNSLRGFWKTPLGASIDLQLLYGWEKVNNLDLVSGVDRVNNLATVELTYRY